MNKGSVNHMSMEMILLTAGNRTRLRILQELDRRGNVAWGEFKGILNITNDSSLRNHLKKLISAGLIRKSPHMKGYELTKKGSKLITFIGSIQGEPRKEVGPTIKIILSGSVKGMGFHSVQEVLRSMKSLATLVRTPERAVFKLASPNSDANIEISANGEFLTEANVPLISVLPVTNASVLREIENQFLHFFRLQPAGTKHQMMPDRVGDFIPSWVLMANSLVWCLMHFLFNATIQHNPESRISLERYQVIME